MYSIHYRNQAMTLISLLPSCKFKQESISMWKLLIFEIRWALGCGCIEYLVDVISQFEIIALHYKL